jgi:hypothetical protein
MHKLRYQLNLDHLFLHFCPVLTYIKKKRKQFKKQKEKKLEKKQIIKN